MDGAGNPDAPGSPPDGGGGGGPAVVVPRWLRALDGVEDQPGQIAVVSDARVAVTLGRAYTVHAPLTVGAGEPGELTLTDPIQKAIAWLDTATGTIAAGRILGAKPMPDGPGGLIPHVLAADHHGGVLATGALIATMRIHPGTPAEQTMTAEQRTLGDSVLAAEDGYVTRYDPVTNPGWIVRGVTPGPITHSGSNYVLGAAALPDGGMLLSGEYGYDDYSFSSHALPASARSYFARLDAAGGLAWLYETPGINVPALPDRLVSTPGGEVYGVAGFRGMTLFATGPAPFTPRYAPPDETFSAYRLDPAGGVLWGDTFRGPMPSFAIDFAAADDGDLIVLMFFTDSLAVVDHDGTVLGGVTASGEHSAVVRFAPDGTLRYAVVMPSSPLADPDIVGDAAAVIDRDGHTIVGAYLMPGTAIPGFAPLPTVPEPGEHYLLALLELAADGSLHAVSTVAADVYLDDLGVVDNGGIVGLISHWYQRPVAFGGGGGGGADWTWIAECPTVYCTIVAAWDLASPID